MAWKVSSTEEPGRFVAHDGTGWSADPETGQALRWVTGKPVMIAPLGSPYKAGGPDDETWLYLAARTAVLPWPLTVTGEPPAVPDVAPIPDGAVA